MYPDGAHEVAAGVIDVFDDNKAEISSWLLSGRTRDDEPMYTVFAYGEMYLRRVRNG